MKKEAYELVKKKYGYCASWAIWADEGKTPKSNMDDVSFFDDDQIHTKLNPDIILLALNFSKDIKFENNFQNFHGKGGGAYKLRLMLKGTSFLGAYMTDIIKDLPEKDANKAYKIWKNPVIILAHSRTVYVKRPYYISVDFIIIIVNIAQGFTKSFTFIITSSWTKSAHIAPIRLFRRNIFRIWIAINFT